MTADPRILVADLRDHHTVSDRFGMWARATDEELAAASFIESILPLWDAWVAANPPCQTCGGMGKVHDSIDTYEPCPTCPDSPGVQSFTEWVAGVVAVWTAVWDDATLACDVGPHGLIDWLRQIGSPR